MTLTEPAALNSAPISANTGWSGLYGMVGASAGTLANSYLNALGQKLAGVNTVPAPSSPAVTDSATSAAAATAATKTAAATDLLKNPIVIGGAVALVGIGIILALSRR